MAISLSQQMSLQDNTVGSTCRVWQYNLAYGEGFYPDRWVTFADAMQILLDFNFENGVSEVGAVLNDGTEVTVHFGRSNIWYELRPDLFLGGRYIRYI